MSNVDATAMSGIENFVTVRRKKCKCGAYFTPLAQDESTCFDCQCEREWQKTQYEFVSSKKERKAEYANR